MTCCYYLRGFRLPAGRFEVKQPESLAGDDHQKEIRLDGSADSVLKDNAVAAQGKYGLGAYKSLSDRAGGRMRIEIAGAIEPNQPRNSPMTPDFVTTAHAS